MRKMTTTPTTKKSDAKRVEVSESQIAARAYERFVARGGVHGHDLEDWLAAERELMDEGGGRPDSPLHLAG